MLHRFTVRLNSVFASGLTLASLSGLDRFLHLLDEKDIKIYFENLKTNLKKDGYVLFAQFRNGGVTSCANLPIKQYSLNEFSNRLGDDFKLIKSEEFDFINPFDSKKEYIYALFQKIKL